MMFTSMVSAPPGFDIRTFECIASDYVETVAIGTKMMGWINSRGLRPLRRRSGIPIARRYPQASKNL
jgi:hypothetical protein